LDRASASGAEGRGFESRLARVSNPRVERAANPFNSKGAALVVSAAVVGI
jgi:hypothetical protein